MLQKKKNSRSSVPLRPSRSSASASAEPWLPIADGTGGGVPGGLSGSMNAAHRLYSSESIVLYILSEDAEAG